LTSLSGFRKVSNLAKMRKRPDFSITKSEKESMSVEMLLILEEFENRKVVEG